MLKGLPVRHRGGALIRIGCVIGALAVACVPGRSAEAGQSGGRSAPEPYPQRRVEVLVGAWHPGPHLRLAATDRDIPGTDIDLRGDLAMEPRWLPDVQARVRVAQRHAFRFGYSPVAADGQAVLQRHVTYLGEVFSAGEHVVSTLDWRVYRFGYAYDFFSGSRLTAAVNVEARHSDLRLGLTSGRVDTRGRSRIPMPAVGGSVRYAVTARVLLTGDAAAFAVPDNDEGTFGGHFIDAAFSTAVDVAPHLAVQIGVRTIDIRHLGKSNAGRGRLTGLSVGAVVGY